MSHAIDRAPAGLVKRPVPLATGMLLTDTFVAMGRGAMILDAPGPSPARPASAAGIAPAVPARPATGTR